MKPIINEESQIIISGITESHAIIKDININAGADYKFDFKFVADDGSDITYYGILIWGGILYLDDQSTEAGEIWDADTTVWDVDGETIEGTSSWNLQAQLREFPEAYDYFEFEFDLDEEGIHMRMPKEITAQIKYIRGVYDVFITDSNDVRTKLIEGTARIVPRIVR